MEASSKVDFAHNPSVFNMKKQQKPQIAQIKNRKFQCRDTAPVSLRVNTNPLPHAS